METGRKTVTLEVLKTVKDFEDNKISELKEDLTDLQYAVLEEIRVKKEYQYGRYISAGFNDNLTTYVRSNTAYSAGKYHINACSDIGYGYIIFAYVSDAKGTAITSTYSISASDFETDSDFYITFNGNGSTISEETIEKIESDFVVTKINTDSDNLQSRVFVLESKEGYIGNPLSGYKATMTDGEYITLENNSIKKNKRLTFMAKVATLSEILVGHGETSSSGYYIKVDGTNFYTMVNGSRGSTIAHGLTIEDYIGVIIDVNASTGFTVTLTTHGGQFQKVFSSGWQGFYGTIFAKSVGSSLTECYLTWVCDDYQKDVWVFGDSYLTHGSNTRWPYWMIKWGFDNCLMNAYPGQASASAYNDLINALTHGTPKVLVWALGMNDKDTSSALNATWLEKVNLIKDLCDENKITLVLCTIPNVSNTSYENTQKNAYIKSSGYRYIDFAEAVGGEESGSPWNEDYLSSDGIHPSETGARILCMKALTDCPELTQSKL